jgi:hypothetical protein
MWSVNPMNTVRNKFIETGKKTPVSKTSIWKLADDPNDDAVLTSYTVQPTPTSAKLGGC